MSTKGLITADELSRIPGGEDYELVRGELVRVNPVSYDHARVAALVAARLIVFAEPRGLGTVTVEAGFILERDPDTMRGPDVSFVRSDRARSMPRQGFAPGAPDLAVEVVSPDNTTKQMRAKADEYLAAGAELVWIIDSRKETALVITPSGSHQIARDGTLDGGATLPGFSLPLAELFEQPPAHCR